MPFIPKSRQSIHKDKFSGLFTGMKSQPYSDGSSSRGSSNSPHTIRSISWNPLGNLVATGSSDRTLRVWNPEKPIVRFSTELKGHNAPIEQVAFNPVKDAELCSVSNDGVVKFWDVRTKAIVNEVKGLGTTFSLVWAPDGESLIVGNKANHLFILSPTNSIPLADHKQTMDTNQVTFSWSGKRVFATTGTGATRILSYPDLKPVYVDPPMPANLTVHRLGESDGSVEGERLLKGHTHSALTVEMSPTGRILATGGADSSICLWDTNDWFCKSTFSGTNGPVRSLSFTFDGMYVVGGSDEGSNLEVTHVESGEQIHTFKTAGASPIVAWAPLKYCLAYSDLGILRILGVDTDRKG